MNDLEKKKEEFFDSVGASEWDEKQQRAMAIGFYTGALVSFKLISQLPAGDTETTINNLRDYRNEVVELLDRTIGYDGEFKKKVSEE